jgi:hypothetical protein
VPLLGASDTDLLKAIGLQCVKLGIDATGYPAEVKQFMCQWLRKYYGKVTLEQFDSAFDMALTGKLDGNTECFGKFTVEYMGRVLSAFQRHLKGAGEMLNQFDAARQYREQSFDRSKVTPMQDFFQQIKTELESKTKIKK